MENANRPAPRTDWRARNLVSIDDLSDSEIAHVLDLAEYYADFVKQGRRPEQRLAGKTQINLFYESSTRTNLSFELAGKKLGADVINVPVAASSVNKGESVLDTAQTLAAMGAAAMILRHNEPRIHDMLAKHIHCPIINAGDGVREHPTQALLDAATIRSACGEIKGRVIAICGDVKHSRVAGSGARLLARLGAEVRFVGPKALAPDDPALAGFPHFDSLKDGLSGADIVMALRMQFERMGEAGKQAAQGYFERFGLTHETLKLAKPDAFVMHPGPMNRGVEIEGALADDATRSLILRQVFYGVAMRMACLDALLTEGR
ncbi:MAG: aspartate carbamoyltransferase catalytic subunit [Alphaproteobacteria bacterium]|nr:aspartate carbamoyltransferase catalytic subunit [Alphaproteobacteria bacterium]